LKDIEFPWPIARIVLQHHERMNGSGYPDALSHFDILLEARIIAVADVVDAMAMDRPYRAAIGLNGALAEISKNKDTLYDANVVDACIQVIANTQYIHEEIKGKTNLVPV
jgi:putative two-component system response regulator